MPETVIKQKLIDMLPALPPKTIIKMVKAIATHMVSVEASEVFDAAMDFLGDNEVLSNDEFTTLTMELDSILAEVSLEDKAPDGKAELTELMNLTLVEEVYD